MFDYLVLLFFVSLAWSSLLLATFGAITTLEHLYCNCKPNYRFTDYVPTNPISAIFLPLMLPLLLIELLYIVTYCIVTKLRT